jgi:hypothetical protein
VVTSSVFFFFHYGAGPLVGVVALLWRIQRNTWLGWQDKIRAVGLVLSCSLV